MQKSIASQEFKTNKKNKSRFFWTILSICISVLGAAAFCIPFGIILARKLNTITAASTVTTAMATTITNGCGWIVQTRVLLLSDTNTATVQTLINSLQSSSLTVNYIPGGISNYTGNPNASCYGSVILIPGNSLIIDMPISGQQSIVNAQQNSGTGAVITEFAASQVSMAKWTTLSSIMLATYVSGTLGVMDFTLINVGHPIWNGLPSTFNTSVSIVYSRLSAPSTGSITIANCTRCTTPAVIVHPQSGTAGRRVQIAHASHYSFSTFNWANDANLLKMMINAVLWAAQII